MKFLQKFFGFKVFLTLFVLVNTCLLATDFKKCNRVGMYIEYKPAYFYPQSSVFRHIYDGGYISLFETGYFINDKYFTFLEIGYFHKDGKVNDVDNIDKTEVSQMPLSLGFGYAYQFCPRFDGYVKLAPNYLYTKTKDYNEYFKHEITKHTMGVTMGIGGKVKINWFLIDIFMNYRYDKKDVHDSLSSSRFHRYLGGFDFGTGIGGRF